MEDVLAALEEIPELMEIYNFFLRKALARHWEGKMLMHQCAAMERYQWFQRSYPGLSEKISNKYICLLYTSCSSGWHGGRWRR